MGIESEIRQKFISQDVKITPCKFCSEEVIFLLLNEINTINGKNKLVPFGLDMELHSPKCRARQYTPRTATPAEMTEKKGWDRKKKKEYSSPEDNW